MRIDEIFKKCEALTMSKRQDYTTNPTVDNHENFKRSAYLGEWFIRPEDKSYAILIGTKLARLASLRSSGRIPNNESIEDSFLDLVNYCALWMERVTSEAKPSTSQLKQVTEQQPTKDISPSPMPRWQQKLQELTRELHLAFGSPCKVTVEIPNTSYHTVEHRPQKTQMEKQRDSPDGTPGNSLGYRPIE